MKDRKPTFEEMVKLAKVALSQGHTRGRFIKDASVATDGMKTLQRLSDAYSKAMEELKQQ